MSAANVAETEYNRCRNFLARNYPKNKQFGLSVWLETAWNAPLKRTFLEQYVDEALIDAQVFFKQEVTVNHLITKYFPETHYVELLHYLKKKNPKLMTYAYKYGVRIKNFTAYRFDSYIPPCDKYPRGALIEADGSQHFKKEGNYVSQYAYSLTNEEFLAGIIRDKIKNIIAEYLGIPLLRISGYQTGDDLHNAKNTAKGLIKNFLNDFRQIIPFETYYRPLYNYIREQQLESETFITALVA